jgi:hypothetical protein
MRSVLERLAAQPDLRKPPPPTTVLLANSLVQSGWARPMKEDPAALPLCQKTLSNWKAAPGLAPVRDAASLGQFPAEERDEWRKSWAEVDARLSPSVHQNPR